MKTFELGKLRVSDGGMMGVAQRVCVTGPRGGVVWEGVVCPTAAQVAVGASPSEEEVRAAVAEVPEVVARLARDLPQVVVLACGGGRRRPEKHRCTKDLGDPTFSEAWSGVSGAPHCAGRCACGERLHHEGDSHYCPRCDDFKPRPADCDTAP